MVESKLVELVVAGSNPVGHPTFSFVRWVPIGTSKPELRSCNGSAGIFACAFLFHSSTRRRDVCAPFGCGSTHQFFVFSTPDDFRQRLANFFKAREVPQIWKVTALLRFDGLHSTIISVEKNTFAVGFIHQGQSAPVGPETGIFLNEVEFAQLFKRGEPRDFSFAQSHLSRPAATGRASLAFVKNWHYRNFEKNSSATINPAQFAAPQRHGCSL